ncbi:MAG: hypothetical protein ACREK8_03040, partial [Gemmatimonadales bacterium]
RGGSRTATRPTELQMVGVVKLDGAETTPANPASPAKPTAAASAAVTPEVAAESPGVEATETAGDRPKTRRGKRGGRKHKAVDAGAATSEAAPSGSPIKSAKAARPSTRRTSKPLAS